MYFRLYNISDLNIKKNELLKHNRFEFYNLNKFKTNQFHVKYDINIYEFIGLVRLGLFVSFMNFY